MLEIDSTSGRERAFAEFLSERLPRYGAETASPDARACRLDRYEVGDGTLNLLFSWGRPEWYFCTHLDTVPPYIPPVFFADRVCGRGSCDAKGQIFSMFLACKELEARGYDGFALLLLSGEETGSHGAQAYTRDCPGGEFVVVGEPTGNCMAVAGKGTKAFRVVIRGRGGHSGYPESGSSAVESFVDFMNRLRAVEWPEDPVLGRTTYNVGRLRSDNPQNVLSPETEFRLYFRTTGASEAMVQAVMEEMAGPGILIEALGGDTPMSYQTFEGFPQCTAAFGSDAPRLSRFARRALCGPGSITVAHTDEEYILLQDLSVAVEQYVAMAVSWLEGRKLR